MAIGKDLQKLQQDLDVLSAEVAALVARPPDEATLVLHELRKRINSVRADFQEVKNESAGSSTAFAMADKIVDPVENTLSERPIATLALGFGFGLVFGLVWGRS
jgi:ElaB/YqjD/DUF883 family membrane-anchored ribosome-binding protein